MKAAELRQKESAELAALCEEHRRELFKLRMQHHTGQLDDTSKLTKARREIARIETVLRERTGGENGT